jgi:eukaryotic-like serine/threonine-protein kinase
MGLKLFVDFPKPFGKYELLERIATGGMAEVYLARSFGIAGFEKQLVIKQIRPEHANNPRFITMFINEAKIGVHLNHPNIVQVYELGKHGQTHYIAMEHLHGRDLTRVTKSLRAQERKLPVPVAVSIVAEVCRGLAYAHARTDKHGNPLGLIHRDVSPHNIVVTFSGEVKLVDFGIARLINTPAEPEDETAGRPAGGKHAYMSPEQALGGAVDHRSDIFAAGIVLWELLVGYRLFQHPDPAKKRELIEQAIVPDPRTRGVSIDETMWEILQKALALRPVERFQSAALFEEALRAWQFEERHRVGATEISAALQEAFPSVNPSPENIDMKQLVADLRRLDKPDDAETPIHTGDNSLPGHLQLPVGARKEVVAVWIDVDGLTELSAKVEPEQLFKRHYKLLRWARRIVDSYHGVVQRSVDDHLLLLFGVPRTRPDDIDRALQCALHLQHRHSELEELLGLPVALAIGVHMGEVTVGSYSRRVRYVARGDTTRLARRLSAAADHDEVLISEQVYQAISGMYYAKQATPLKSRGGKADISSYEVGARHFGTRLEATGAWIRRGAELEILSKALVALGNGQGSCLMITGDVGMGKSRLVSEIQKAAKRRSIPSYTGYCTLRAKTSPLRTLVLDILGLDQHSDRKNASNNLEALTEVGLNADQIECLASLVAMDNRVPPRADLVTEAVNAIIKGIVEQGPLIIIMESVHHLGFSARDELLKLLRRQDRPVLFLLTHTGPQPKEFNPHSAEVALGPFPIPAQHRLIRNLLGADLLEPEVSQLLQNTCEGNPLYLTTMVKYLMHHEHVIVQEGRASLKSQTEEIDLPHSMAGLISARIDALDPAAKGVLQLAAVIGPTFSVPLLAQAAGIEDLSPLIAELAHCGLVHKSGREQQSEWSFSSTFVRESGLRGTLGVQRRDYHRLIASSIEALYADELEDWHEALIEHCFQGGRPLDGVRHAYAAGERFAKSQYLERAKHCYSLGIWCIEHTPEDPDSFDVRTQAEATLYLRLGMTNLLLGDHNEGEAQLQIALELASEYGLSWIAIPAHLNLGESYLKRHKYDIASAHIQQVRSLLRYEEDEELELQALRSAALLAYEEGRNNDAEALWTEALSLCADRPAHAATCRLGLANRFERAGEYERSVTLLLQALQEARAAGDRILEGRVLNNIGIHHSHRQHFDEALYFYRTALEVREGIGYTKGVIINHHNIGDVHFSRGDYAKAAVAFDRSRDLASQVNDEACVLINQVYLGYIDAERGLPGLEKISQSIERARNIGDGETLVIGQWLLAKWHASQDDQDAARALLAEAAANLNQWGLHNMKPHLDAVFEHLADPT